MWSLLICYNNSRSAKTAANNLWKIDFHFHWPFTLFYQGIKISVAFKMLHTFLLKRTKKMLYSKKNYVYSNNSNGKDLTPFFKMGLSWTINNFSLSSKLKLLESLDKMVKSLKVYVAVTSQQIIWNNWDCLTFLIRLFVKCKIPKCSVALT